ncbi:MAG: exodeoxyribonuclease III [Patescibacteria group bacterium]|nr:exodeoxyribonuclease III [Patescibacteria group bacterium]
MKLLSWNVNGIRAAVKKGFADFLKSEKPDILCLQEIKISDDARNKEVFDFAGYQEYWHSAVRPGYSGTMTLVKDGIEVLGEEKFIADSEGRAQILEFAGFYLANVYFPNANHELSRLDFKLKFNDRLLKFLKKLEMKPTPPSAPLPGRGINSKKTKPIIVCGDFNVAHEPIDLFHPKENEGNPGYTAEERGWMTKFLQAGFVDAFRAQNPEKAQYSWWSFRMNARARNIGWRIDYFCVSGKLMKSVKSSFIMNEIMGSDHCPVGIILDK